MNMKTKIGHSPMFSFDSMELMRNSSFTKGHENIRVKVSSDLGLFRSRKRSMAIYFGRVEETYQGS